MSGLHFAGVSADPSRPKGLLGVQMSLIILPTIHCKMYMKVVFFNDFIKTWLESRRPEMIFDRIRIQEHVAAQATEVLLEFFELDCERLISLQSHTLADLTFLTVNKSQYVRLNSIRAQSGSPEGGHLGFSRSVSIQGGLQSEGGFVPI